MRPATMMRQAAASVLAGRRSGARALHTVHAHLKRVPIQVVHGQKHHAPATPTTHASVNPSVTQAQPTPSATPSESPAMEAMATQSVPPAVRGTKPLPAAGGGFAPGAEEPTPGEVAKSKVSDAASKVTSAVGDAASAAAATMASVSDKTGATEAFEKAANETVHKVGEAATNLGAATRAAASAIGNKASEVSQMMAEKVGMSSNKPSKGSSRFVEPQVGPIQGITTAAKGTSRLGAEDRVQRSIVDLIKHDHSMIKMLYGQYVDSIDLEVKKAKVYSLIYEMSRHNACEELIFYTFLRTDPRIPSGFSIANRSAAEHAQITKQLAAVDKVHVGNPDWEAQLSSAVHAFMKHADEEEDSVLPLVASKLDQRELLELGEKFENAETIVTTRPHPLAPTEGALGVAAHMASKPIDMLRDKMQGRDGAIKDALDQEAGVTQDAKREEQKQKDKAKGKQITSEEAIST